jgi:hypothetical protein
MLLPFGYNLFLFVCKYQNSSGTFDVIPSHLMMVMDEY